MLSFKALVYNQDLHMPPQQSYCPSNVTVGADE